MVPISRIHLPESPSTVRAINEKVVVPMLNGVNRRFGIGHRSRVTVSEKRREVRNRISAQQIGQQTAGPVAHEGGAIVQRHDAHLERGIAGPRVADGVENALDAALPLLHLTVSLREVRNHGFPQRFEFIPGFFALQGGRSFQLGNKLLDTGFGHWVPR